jgi:crotonobetainyl-CoA:carnitine CoA-transferase CaiB-like acyl-CoA transferase
MTRLPLEGIRIIEPGQLVAAPFASALMADFGAEVIKTEMPGRGDPLRQLAPIMHDGNSVWWKTIARNKKSVTLDLRTAEGQALFKRLAERADVVLENFRPGVMDRWGLGWEDLRKVNPRLIMARQSGFGQDGPYAARPAYGMMVEGYGGLTATLRHADTAPSLSGICDHVAGLSIAYAVMFALYHRDVHGGPGQLIDNAASENVLRVAGDPHLTSYSLGLVSSAARRNSKYPSWPEGSLRGSGVFPTADDRHVALHSGTAGTSIWENFMKGMGRPDFLLEKDYPPGSQDRADRGREIELAVRAFFAERSQAEIIEFAEANDVTIAPIRWMDDILEDPQLKHRGAFVEVPDAGSEPLTMIRPTPVLSETPGEVRHAGPTLGANNQEIYGRLLGLSEEEMDSLRNAGVI